MYDREDTIAAIATPSGAGAIGIIRVSGKDSAEIVSRFSSDSPTEMNHSNEFKPRRALLRYIFDPAKKVLIDEVILIYYKEFHSYTGEDSFEIIGHGGQFIIHRLLDVILDNGARLALPGEFTFRAYMNGKLDLVQAESVADIIHAQSEKALQQSLKSRYGTLSREIFRMQQILKKILAQCVLMIDFIEEDVPPLNEEKMVQTLEQLANELLYLEETVAPAKLIKEGLLIPITGLPNVGKSSLLNFFLKNDRAIVSPIPGTTRDSIEEAVSMNGYHLRFIDTAGIRKTEDPIEREGVRRTWQIVEQANLLLVLLQPGHLITPEESDFLTKTTDIPRIIMMNKIDTINTDDLPLEYNNEPLLHISILKNRGMAELEKMMLAKIDSICRKEKGPDITGEIFLTSERQKRVCNRARKHITAAAQGIGVGLTPELITTDIEEALHALGEIAGETTPDDVLEEIFSNYCIGK